MFETSEHGENACHTVLAVFVSRTSFAGFFEVFEELINYCFELRTSCAGRCGHYLFIIAKFEAIGVVPQFIYLIFANCELRALLWKNIND